MSYNIKLFWRLPLYGMLLILHLTAPSHTIWPFLMLLTALSMSLMKAYSCSLNPTRLSQGQGQGQEHSQRRYKAASVGFAIGEWLLLIAQTTAPLNNHSLDILIDSIAGNTVGISIGISIGITVISALCLGDYIWLRLAAPKYTLPLFAVQGTLPFVAASLSPLPKTTETWAVLFTTALGVLLIACLAYALRDLEIRKLRAQEYYDQLRTSEQALKTAHAELEAYYNTLEEVVALRERNRISRDIHDNVGHALATTLIQLQALSLRLAKAPENSVAPEAAMLTTLADFVRDALTRTRQVVHDMVPKQLTFEQFRHDLAELCHKTQTLSGIRILLTTPPLSHSTSFNGDCHAHLYNLVKEALTNAIKHGEAQTIKVILITSEAGLQITISDDGRGAEAFTPAFGIQGIQERLHQLGGSLEVKTSPGAGFTLIARLPLKPAAFNQEGFSHGSL